VMLLAVCGRQGVTLSHILGGCHWVREVENKLHREDRYTWRHNNVLLLIATAIKEHIIDLRKKPDKKDRCRLITFIPAGHRPPSNRSTSVKGLLAQASDWSLQFDLPEFRLPGSSYLFPHEICATPLKIDGCIISREKRICIGLELTVPMEENIPKWHRLKASKYEDLQLEARQNGWKLSTLVIEVGSRGWIPSSAISIFHSLGLPSSKELCNRLSHAALKSSYIIWLNRFNKDFKPWRLEFGKPYQ